MQIIPLKRKIKTLHYRAVSKGSGDLLSSGALKTEQLRFLFYRLIDQACFIKYLVACRHALASSFLLFRVQAVSNIFREPHEIEQFGAEKTNTVSVQRNFNHRKILPFS